jgi:predicted glycosyltransferase
MLAEGWLTSANARDAMRGFPVEAPRILLYAHDPTGTEGMRRALVLAEALAEEFPDGAIAIVASAPSLRDSLVPEPVGLIRLPEPGRIGEGRGETDPLEGCRRRLQAARRDILGLAVTGFRPDLVIVDERPGGFEGELLGAIDALRAQRPDARFVLGLPDVTAGEASGTASLGDLDVLATIERMYDEVWIYGSREVFDVVGERAFPEGLARRSHFCGYLQRGRIPPRRRSGAPRVLVMVDDAAGTRLAGSYLDGIRWLDRSLGLRTSIVVDPDVSSALRDELLRCVVDFGDVEFHDLGAGPERHFADADVVLCSARYADVCEVLASGHRAVLVSSEDPDAATSIRARRLRDLGLFEVIEPSALAPDLVMTKTLDALEAGRRRRGTIDLGGLAHVRERARAMLARRAGASA